MINVYKDLKIAFKVALAIAVVLLIIRISLGGSISLKVIGENIFNSILYGVPLSLFNGWLFDGLTRLYPWEKHPKQRAILGIIASIILTLATLVVLNYIHEVFLLQVRPSNQWIAENRTFYIVALIITIVVSITFHAISFFQQVQNEKMLNAQLQQEKLMMQLTALRDQVDPHFLFNSFNVLSGLIDENPEKAQHFLSELSAIYRYVLEQKEDDLSTLVEELTFADKYLNLQKMRFENSIQVNISVPTEKMKLKIPSLSLQLLLENAIKHNAFDEENPLNIAIIAENGYLEVSNTFNPRTHLSDRKGIGLNNIRQRYALMEEKEIEVYQENHLFTVKIPLI